MSLSGSDWVKLSRLLDQALDLEPAQRSQWMESLPPEYESLRETLRDLLMRKVGVETADIMQHAPALPDAPFAPMAPGDAVGPYQLIREIGAGGMSTVWLAERADGGLQRQVALKLPRIAWMDRGLAERLNRERDILASLEHPHIARLYDAGVDGAGRPFLALEYVDGVALDKYVTCAVLSVPQRLHLFLQVARAIAFAHARLVVHRDLKPSNVLVKGDGSISLLDFGIARLLQPDPAREPQLTEAGARALTPHYAAPEQFLGKAITVSTDVYSLGVLLYSLLTDRSPYGLQNDTIAELEAAVLARDPVPMEKAVDRKRARPLRGDLEMIVRKALRKQPADRYETVNAFIDDIERYQKQLPVRAQPERFTYRLRKFVLRNRAPVALGAVTGTALLLGLGAVLWQANVARVEAQRAERIKSFIASIFTQAKPKVGEGGVVTASELLSAANLRVESELADRGDKSELQIMIGDSFLALGEPAKAEPVFRQALANCEAAAANFAMCELRGAVFLAGSLKLVGKDTEALEVLEKHTPAATPTDPRMFEDYVTALRLRGEVLGNLDRIEAAGQGLQHALALADQLLAPDHVATLSLLETLIYFNSLIQDQDEAVRIGAEAVRRARASRGHLRPEPRLSRIEGAYASALVGASRGMEAEPVLRQVLADQRKLEPEYTQGVADAEWLLGYALANIGKFDEALPLMQRYMEWDRQHGTESNSRREHLMHVGFALISARRADAALQVADEVVRLEEVLGHTSESQRVRNQVTRARALAMLGRTDVAQHAIRSAIDDAAAPKLSAVRLAALGTAAFDARLQNRGAEAGRLARQMQQEMASANSAPHVLAVNWSDIAAALLAAGDEAGARYAVEQAGAAFARTGFPITVRFNDYLVTRARLNLQASDTGLERDLAALAAAWEGANPGSAWHAEALYWLSRVQRNAGESEVAALNAAAARKILRNSPLPALRALVS